MKVIILAGGKGTRLLDSAKNIPKSLVEIAGKPILQHQIDLLEQHGLTDIRFSLGHKADQIIKYLEGKPRTNPFGIIRGKYEYVIEPKSLGTGGAIKFASQNLKDAFMVLNGDILSNIDFSKFIQKYQNVSRETLGIIGAYYLQDARDFGLVDIENDKIVRFLEKPKQEQPGYVNTGIYILSPKIFSNVSRETFSIEQDIFPKIAKNNQLAVYIHKGYWTDLGTEERLNEAQKLNQHNNI